MKVFIVQGNLILVCNLAFTTLGREEFRARIREDFNTPHVWFEDEVGTAHDPVRGPNPVFGPKAPPPPAAAASGELRSPGANPGTGGNAGPAPPPAGPGSPGKETH
jgi:hypothetical protein